jgi:hypothetical protein
MWDRVLKHAELTRGAKATTARKTWREADSQIIINNYLVLVTIPSILLFHEHPLTMHKGVTAYVTVTPKLKNSQSV